MSIAVVNRTRWLAWQAFHPKTLARKVLPDARVADQHDVGALSQEGEIEQAQNAILGLYAAFVVVKVEGVDAGLRLQTRALEAALDGAALPRFQFQVGEPLDG